MEEVYTLNSAPKNLKYKWRYLFGNLKYKDLLKIQMDNTSTFSVTDYKTSDIITNLILNLHEINKNSLIVDGTSCVGGNVISFAKSFKHVFAIEFNEHRLKLLDNNINVYNLNNKVTTFNGDVTVLYKDLPNVDIYFLDPPWGGINYLNSDKLDLYLSGIHLANFCIMLKDHTNFIVLKLPLNFNEESFCNILLKQDTTKKYIDIYEIHNMKKMLIIILKNNVGSIRKPKRNIKIIKY